MKIIQITGAALLVLAVGALAGVGRLEAAGGASDDAQEGITVTGTGELRSTPNRANLSFSVHAEGSTAAGALAAGNAKLRRLIDALKGAGVDQEQLKTEYLGVNPRYDGGKTPSNGYTADASVSVTGQSLERASRLVDLGMSAGADSVSGPSLSIADRDAQYRRALERIRRCPSEGRGARRCSRCVTRRGDGGRRGRSVRRPGPGDGGGASGPRGKDANRAGLREDRGERDGDVRDQLDVPGFHTLLLSSGHGRP
jgi:Protein of unknown function (DUF541)